ncbi:hypothetical protein BJX70DRAFT_391746 [Aspergillus crustosus]
MALCGPWCSTSIVARSVVIAAVVAATALLPRSYITGRGGAFPGLLVVATIAVGTSLNSANCSVATAVVQAGAGVVAPVAAPLAIRTITGHMTGVATNATDDVGSEITLLRAVRSMNVRYKAVHTVLASLVLIVTKCTVERGQFSKLVPLELVLAFRDRGSLFGN